MQLIIILFTLDMISTGAGSDFNGYIQKIFVSIKE